MAMVPWYQACAEADACACVVFLAKEDHSRPPPTGLQLAVRYIVYSNGIWQWRVARERKCGLRFRSLSPCDHEVPGLAFGAAGLEKLGP
jgi:hypothetical protein